MIEPIDLMTKEDKKEIEDIVCESIDQAFTALIETIEESTSINPRSKKILLSYIPDYVENALDNSEYGYAEIDYIEEQLIPNVVDDYVIRLSKYAKPELDYQLDKETTDKVLSILF